MREDALFVLRLWNDGNGEEAWRASLENLRTKQSLKFANLQALARYLEALPRSKARGQNRPRKEVEE